MVQAVLVAALFASSAGLTAQVGWTGDHSTLPTLHAGPEGARSSLTSDAGLQYTDVRTACLPGQPAQCQNDVDCAPGSLDCHATSRPAPPWPCAYQPDGSLRCSGNDTQPNATPPSGTPSPSPPANPPNAPGLPACGDLFAPAVCARIPGAPSP